MTRRARTKSAQMSASLSARRWRVHLALIATFVLALVVLLPNTPWHFTSHSFLAHEIIGLGFFAVLVVHLAQRRRTIARLVRRASHQAPTLAGDSFLAVVALSTLVSGIVDWARGHPVSIAFFQGLTPLVSYWHRFSVLVLLVAVVRHVVRRRRRLRTSRID